MAPPCFADVGKAARDLLSKGYHFGVWKMEAKGQSDCGLKLKVNGVHNTDNGNVLAGLECEYACKDYGMKFVEKWNTDNVMSTEVSVEDQGLKGLKVTLDGSFNPSTGNKRGVVKSSYKGEYCNTNLDIDVTGGPVVRGSTVAAYKGMMAGAQFGYDLSKSQLTGNNFVVGMEGSDFGGYATITDQSQFGGSLHHKLSRDLETAVSMGWAAGTNNTTLNLGMKYCMSSDTTLRAKVSNQSQVALSVQQKLKDGVSVTLSSLVDAKNFAAGGHRVGLSVDFEQ